MTAAAFRDCGKIGDVTKKALALSRDLSSLHQSATALAACGQSGPAESLVDELIKRFPQDTLLNAVSIPLIRAEVELNRGNGVQAVQ